MAITTGSTVTWTNNDSTSHTITGDDGSWGSNRLAKGETFFFTFTEAGTFSYHCSAHPSMTATITVVAPQFTQQPGDSKRTKHRETSCNKDDKSCGKTK